MKSIPEHSLSAQRRAIFERVQERNLSQGMVLDDPAYLHLMEAWIAGEMEMEEASTRWDTIRLNRIADRRASASNLQTTADVLPAEPFALIEGQAQSSEGTDMPKA